MLSKDPHISSMHYIWTVLLWIISSKTNVHKEERVFFYILIHHNNTLAGIGKFCNAFTILNEVTDYM